MATLSKTNSTAKKLRLANMKALINKQEDLLKAKNKDWKNYSKLAKSLSKGKGVQVLMQQQQILNSKKQDAFRTKQQLLLMKLQYKKEKAK